MLAIAIYAFIFFGGLADQFETFDLFHYFVPPMHFLLPLVASGIFVTVVLLIIGAIYKFRASREEGLILILDLIVVWIVVRTFVMIITIFPTPENSPWGIDLFIDKILLFKKDLFYSGHAGLPYLGYKIFSKSNKTLSWAFLIWSLIMGFSVLATRVHYLLDVVGAYVFTDWIYYKYKYTNIFNFDKKIARLYREYKRKKIEKESYQNEDNDDLV